ncbi:hypothetical protein [Paraburkholderia rhynchosiae]|uniref:Uncharacterized protein n=1 Tax=Paraburkholderia rhynchosiae TaxID=487049 RepID=A0A6J5AGA7_9BURK|nr:hypothetical protein [Paraburkholderia rhynchosiae]CAB3667852.1 hypothetical protein LMG27174_01984 [Paraburkholderia rhynchosiae]
MKTAAAHNFGIVIVYTTLREQRGHLARISLQWHAVFESCEGNRIPHDVENSDAWWLHFIAHKPASTNPACVMRSVRFASASMPHFTALASVPPATVVTEGPQPGPALAANHG